MRPAFIVLTLLFAVLPPAIAQQPRTAHPDIDTVVRQTAGRNLIDQRVFMGDFTGDGQADAVAFIYYDLIGSAGGIGLRVALFQGEGNRFRFLRDARDVFGQDPRQPSFRPGEFQITTTMPRPGDPRCCPTGERRFTVRVAGPGAGSGAAAPQPSSPAPVQSALPPWLGGLYCVGNEAHAMLSADPTGFWFNNGGDGRGTERPRTTCAAPDQCTVRAPDGRQWQVTQLGGRQIRVRGPDPWSRPAGRPLNLVMGPCR